MKFESLKQIQDHFDLSGDDLLVWRKQLRKMQIDLHPDKHGGQFSSPSEQSKYFEIDSAIELIDQDEQKTKALIPLSSVQDLIEIIRESNTSKDSSSQTLEKIERNLSDNIEKQIANVGSKYLFPKITVSAIALVLTAMWVFPSTISEHPVLKRLIDTNNIYFTAIWLFSICVTALFWLYLKNVEIHQKEFKAKLKSSSFQNKLFDEFLNAQKQKLVIGLIQNLTNSIGVRTNINKYIESKLEVIEEGRSQAKDFLINLHKVCVDQNYSQSSYKQNLEIICYFIKRGFNMVDPEQYFLLKKKDFSVSCTKDDFANYLLNYSIINNKNLSSMLKFFFFSYTEEIDLELAQSLANVIFQIAEKKNLIAKCNEQSFSTIYKFTNESFFNEDDCRYINY